MKTSNALPRPSPDAVKTGRTLRAVPILAFALLALASCAAGRNDLVETVRPGAEAPAGFLLGLWHGMIAFVTFIVSLFNKNVNVYEVHNTGATYNLGFVIGVMIAFGGGAKGSCRKKRRD